MKPTDYDYLSPQLKAMPAFRGFLRAVEARFYRDIQLAQPVIDLGCGDGHFASETFDDPLTFGIDPWWSPLQEAGQYGIYEGLAQSDGAYIPAPNEYFASAISNSVLEHIPHLDEVLVELHRVLKPGAQFIFCSPSHNFLPFLSISNGLRKIGLKRLGTAYEEFFNKISRHYTCDSAEQWIERLERCGFETEQHWYYFSKSALRALEWGHYWGLPSLITKKLFGKWILWPSDANLALTDWYLRRYYDEPLPEQGAYVFFIARRV